MKIFKNISLLFISMFLMLGFTSCLKSGLEDLPAYDQANITSFKFEYRYKIPVGNAGDKMQITQLTVSCSVDADNKTVSCKITVPASRGTFTSSEKSKVSLSNIAGIATISTAATIKPINGAPKLGYISDFSSKSYEYEVIAADGVTKSTWKLIITDFVNN